MLTRAELLRIERIHEKESDPDKRLLMRWNLAASEAGFKGSEYVDEPETVFARVEELKREVRDLRFAKYARRES